MLCLSVLPSRAMSQAERSSEAMAGVSSEPWLWMRGVPQGYRLVSMDLPGKGLELPVGQVRGEVAWQYVDADGQQAWTLLLPDVQILRRESLAGREGSIGRVRLTVPLAPVQADRLKAAAACGRLRLQMSERESASDAVSTSTWPIVGVEDQTRQIERRLANEAGDPNVLERPTLAAPRGPVIGSIRGTITVPVEMK